MSNQTVSYEYEHDRNSVSNEYPCTSIVHESIIDSNNGSYQGGVINFNNVNVNGADSNKQFYLHKAYTTLPIVVKMTANNCTFTSDGTNVVPSNKYAVGLKPFHHLVDRLHTKFGQTTVLNNTEFNNLVMNENLKKMDLNEQLIVGNVLNYELDSTHSYGYSTAGGEFNNAVSPDSFSSSINNGHKKRMDAMNLRSAENGLSAIVGDSSLDASYQWRMITNSASTLEFSGVAPLPLALLNDLYSNLPSMSNIRNLEIKMSTNISSSNSYTINYAGKTASNGTPNVVTSIDVVQPVGRTCPFLVSNCGEPEADGPNALSKYGLTVTPNNTSAFSVTITATIGKLSSAGSLVPCNLVIPAVALAPQLATKILEQPIYRALYNDYQVFEITNISAGSKVSRNFNSDISRARLMHIVPFLSKVSNVATPYASPISSAPTTCSPSRMGNLYVKVGNQNIYPEALNYTYQYYLQNIYENMGKINGNSLKSPFKTGLITKSMFERIYGVATFNIERVSSEGADNNSQLFGVDFVNNNLVTMDYIVIIEYQRELSIDRSTGIVGNPFMIGQ